MRHYKNYIILIPFLLVTVAVLGQVAIPASPSDDNEHCSRENATRIFGIAEPSVIGQNKSVMRVAACPTSAAEWASMSSSALVSTLKQSLDKDCFTSFFTIEPSYAPYIFSSNNIYAVATEVYNSSVSYDGTKNSGLYGLLYYLHAAAYQDFYNDDVSMSTNSVNRFILAGESLADNPNLWLATEDALDILDEYLIILDFDGLRHKAPVLNLVKKVFYDLAIAKTWKQTPSSLHRKYASAYNRVFFLMFRGMQDDDYIDAVNEDNTFFSRLYNIASESEIKNHDEFGFMNSNAVLELSRAAQSPLLIDDVEYYLAQIAQNNPRLSPSWLKAVEAINEYGNCSQYGLCEDVTQLRVELEQMLFPNNYSFDDGKMKIRTPLNEDEVQMLYHAAKQTQSQFYRMIQTNIPVEGDVNDTLNMVVFGSKKAYEDYATYLYGIATNNGGMYIERGATFYTWDRTVGVESSLSLEALFRHEYVHYLQGRYLIQGYWGENEIYENSRMVWYEEGMAEFFAGSTDTNGIRLLASNVNIVKNNNGSWPSLTEVFNSSYISGNFNHYYYGNMAWYNWYLNDFNKLKTFFDLTRANDIAGFDNLVNTLKSSGHNQYNDFLTDVANNAVEGWEPQTQWLTDTQLAIGTETDIKDEFVNLTGENQVSVTTDANALNRRFRLEGSISGQHAAATNADAAQQMNETLDSLMNQLRADPLLSNFNYTVGYFTDMDFGSSVPTAHFVVTGPLRDENISDTPVAGFSSNQKVTITGGSVNFDNESSGYVKSLNWSFEGGSPQSVSDQISPQVVYNTAGNFDVSLTAANQNSSNTKLLTEHIKVYDRSDNVYCPASGELDHNYISLLNFGTINNSSSHEGFGNFTSFVTELQAGESETLEIMTINDHWELNAVGAWIDWNGDGDFDDSDENIYSKLGEGPYVSTINVPQHAINGVTTLRVRLAYSDEDKIVPCGNDTYLGEVEDYSIVILGNGSTPVAPVAAFSASSQTVSTGGSVTFTDESGNTPNEWQWTFSGGTPATSTDQHPTVSYGTSGVYDVQLIATNSAGSDTLMLTDYITVESGSVTYCSSSSDRSSYEHIAEVTLNDFSYSSGATNYSDFTDVTIGLDKGANSITLTPGFSGDAYAEYFRVWIDYNGDGDFEDVDELAFDAGSTSTTAVSGTLTVPTSAQEGSTRMRVSMKYNGAPSSCETFADGEVEDYTVQISPATFDPPAAPSALSATSSSSSEISLSWSDNSSDETGFEIERSQGGGYVLVTTLGSDVTSYADGGLMAETTYSYRVRSKNSVGYSAYSNVSNATTMAATTPDYCTASAGNPSGQYIQSVTIGDISNGSSYEPGGYSDYTSQQTSVGSTATLTVTPHTTWGGTQAKGWVDWNRDGDFSDSGEEVYSVTGTGNYSRVITIPGTASGRFTIRVRVAYGQAPTPCGNIHFSETEDYSLDAGGAAGPSGNTGLEALSVYPNPVDNEEFQFVHPPYKGELEVSIFSLNGHLMHKEVLEERNFNGVISIKVKHHLKGLHMLRISTNDMSVIKKVQFN